MSCLTLVNSQKLLKKTKNGQTQNILSYYPNPCNPKTQLIRFSRHLCFQLKKNNVPYLIPGVLGKILLSFSGKCFSWIIVIIFWEIVVLAPSLATCGRQLPTNHPVAALALTTRVGKILSTRVGKTTRVGKILTTRVDKILTTRVGKILKTRVGKILTTRVLTCKQSFQILKIPHCC